MFEKELKEYLKAKDTLRTKIIHWLDGIDDEFIDEDCCVCIEIDGLEFVIERIRDGKLITQEGDEFNYREYDVDLLLDLQGEILNYYSDVNYR